ncbi:hypothetical protein [Methanobrevibacter millerae]|uniref:DUF3467 domain-containing protein n=1 Tax=Methanobrevibacter millerae TaxID=230361 RepID=A0A1G5WMR1_9EURY|nr:hypothetical protein [Methanobrevibacter millerae]SDA59448.1 hypothetical protein SAMN02910315_01523 [Methanobrevibacter millerae]
MSENQLNFFIPEHMDEINVVGGAVTSTPFNIRLLLFNDEIERNCDIVKDNVKIIRTGKAEIVMHPQVAKNIAELLLKEVENYQNKFTLDK